MDKDQPVQNDRDLSFILDDGNLAETIYDPAKKYTAFAVGGNPSGVNPDGKPKPIDEDDIVIIESVRVDGLDIKPIKPTNEMLTLGFIKLPSGVEQYKLKSEATEEENNIFLFNTIQRYLKAFVSLPEDFYPICALYIIMTWVYEKFSIVPYLRVVGTFGTGKSRFVNTVGSICRKPMSFNGATSAAGMYRTIDWFKGSVVFDESDFKNSDLWSSMVKILNAGHEKNSPVVKIETKRDGQYVPKAFYIFGPKIFASRERFADEALESRCLTQRLQNGPIGKYPIMLPLDFEVQSGQLRKWLLMFRFKYYNKLKVEEIDMPGIQTPRIKQTLSAITVIAKLLGNDTLDRVLKFGKRLDDELRSQMRDTVEVEVLMCLMEILTVDDVKDEHGKPKYNKHIHIKDLADKYNSKFYEEYNGGKTKIYGGVIFGNSNYIVPAKRIGGVVAKLGLRKVRDGQGYFIPASEYPKIFTLADSYGITPAMLDSGKEAQKPNEPLSETPTK